ncbi:hypothetical protein BIW11_10193, partial [Tropilaelaps mercedesae]
MNTQPSSRPAVLSTSRLRLINKSQPICAKRFQSAAWILITKPHFVDSRLTGGDILECWKEPSRLEVTVTAALPQLTQDETLYVRRKLVPKNPKRFSGVYEECR